MGSFIDVHPDSHFSYNNLPWGIFSKEDGINRVGVALGDYVIDVKALYEAKMLSGPLLGKLGSCFAQDALNNFMSLGRPAWLEAREVLRRLLSSSEGALRDDVDLRSSVVLPKDSVEVKLPARIGDYTDFYVSKEHATTCGAIFRGPGHELTPNWLHLPVGYHGRSSSIVVSGTSVKRPRGQVLPAGATQPIFTPSKAVDFELEMACFIGPGNTQGEPIHVDKARDHIFGVVLMNDWSARDIQKWEYVPLGPFNGKNWATQISPWVVSPEALEPFVCGAPRQEPPVLDYLVEGTRSSWDINLGVELLPQGWQQPARVTTSNFKYMYFTWAQMIAHHTAGGCNLLPGDLLGSGTISGSLPGQRGCLLEATWGGRDPLLLQPGQEATTGSTGRTDEARGPAASRVYLEDGDTVILSGFCQGPGYRVGFGECRGQLLPCPAGQKG
mmetsp:Transcript_25202/g.54778  ORF Transcript_25202/g.54778 Transcript_25202/m.54778 type:complete len:442 (+) Transcript_25202:32-1357(+)